MFKELLHEIHAMGKICHYQFVTITFKIGSVVPEMTPANRHTNLMVFIYGTSGEVGGNEDHFLTV